MIPTSLYIHIPWCVKKCPYCDFNSHAARDQLPELDYINALIRDLENDLPLIWGRKIQTIFIGGGTPSLFSPHAIEQLLQQLHARLAFSPTIEITMEANPGTVEQQRFNNYRTIGINRLSLGIQSFQNDKLKQLGRIHDSNEANVAIEVAKSAGFDNFNIDLMFGLPRQTLSDALDDINQAINHHPTHLSWYQLTIEPNTRFHQFPPALPLDDHIFEMQSEGQKLLAAHDYEQYEISAYSRSNHQCQHNRNYWEFGDYLGIGAGAHSKITDPATGIVTRHWKMKHPKQYLTTSTFTAGQQALTTEELPLEFMMNALRLNEKIPIKLFEERTGLPITALKKSLEQAQSDELLIWSNEFIQTTSQGRLYLNDLLALFM